MMEITSVLLNESASKQSHHYRILVVDDNEGCAKMLMWTMEMLGHDAQFALSGQTAIELAKSFRPEIVLLDIGMPGMNGYETCEAMNKEPGLENTIFIAQTGWGQKEHQERSKKSGFHHHLVKPINIEALKNIIFDIRKT